MSDVLKSVNFKLVGLYLGIFLLATGGSWIAFSLISGKSPTEIISPTGIEDRRGRIDLNAPKNETCPLNGAKFTKAEREIWEKRRPLTVMIENHQDSRPQSGVSSADVVYEAVAEGGITRFLAVFYCGAAHDDLIIGPVRSARIYFMDWAQEYGDFPLYAHVGGANRVGPADALGAISKLGWISQGNDMNQFAIGFPTFWRDYERIGHPVATEHTMYASTDKLWELAQERGLTNKNNKGDSWDKNFTLWKFSDSASGENAPIVEFPFWKGHTEYSVRWIWDAAVRVWKRESGGQLHTDLNNKEQLQVSTVIVQFTVEKSLNDPEKHMLYTTTGKGNAIVFRDGIGIRGTWQKDSPASQTKFIDSKGKEIELAPGPIWIEILPTGTEVSY